MLSLGPAQVRWTGRREGDLGIEAGSGVDARRHAVHAGDWSWLRQVHGATVHVVQASGPLHGAEGDALVTTVPGAVLAVFSADCATVALSSPEGVIGAAHAGWRGLTAGVLEATVATMRDLGATRIVAALGPVIRPECYEFGAAELDAVAARFGPVVRASTPEGRTALDLGAGVRAALDDAGALLVYDEGSCTACSGRYFSHRARGESGRQALVVVR